MATCTPAGVRLAQRADFTALAGVLARAFYDDPVTTWFYPNPRWRLRHAERFFAIRLRQLAPQQLIYTTGDRSGAALWTRPGRWREDARQSLMLLALLPALLPRLRATTRAVRVIERHHPVDEHYYLSVLGTEPRLRGEGMGSALMTPVLERCDAERMPAFLESSKESNVGFYSRLGFVLTDEVALPGGPPLWLMWRQPQPAESI